MKIEFDIDRIIDDFIFLCFFVGNDFLPRIYSFQIRIGSLGKLVDLFKLFLVETDDYLHKKGKINWNSFLKLISKISRLEMSLMNEKLQDYKSTLDKLMYQNIYDKFNEIQPENIDRQEHD